MANREAMMTGIEWTPAQAEALCAALAARGSASLGYCELAGFLFALACAPEPVMPSEWIAKVLGDEESAFDSLEEAQRVTDLVMALHNRINVEVMERKPVLPAGIELRADPMQNFGPQAPLGQWAGGFGAGQLWVEKIWDRCLRDEPDLATLDGRRSLNRT
jgi:yecA family protein